jgi:GAF domain-containing protein
VLVSESEFEHEVNVEIARLARSLHSHQTGDLDVDDLLREVTESATRTLPHVTDAGVTLVSNRRRKEVQSLAATGPIPRTLDSLQEKHQQGPCLESIWDHHTVVVDDYASEERWPEFTVGLREQSPVRSSLSIQLYTNESELGALNLYSEKANAFTAQIEELALVLAAHAAVGLASARREDQLQSALATRDIIGQAKGIVMERHNVDAVRAFNLLVKLSQDTNTPVEKLAQRLVNVDHPLEET